MRIALVTPFSPEIAVGSAQLRSHLRYLPELDVQWYYLAKQPAGNSANIVRNQSRTFETLLLNSRWKRRSGYRL